MNIINFYKTFRKKKMLQAAKANILIDSSSHLTDSFSVRQDVSSADKRLFIGKDCIIGGQFIFESSKGKICIGDHTFIGSSTFISRSSITVGNNVTIAWGSTIYDHDSHSLDYQERRKDIDDELADLRGKQNMIAHKNWDVVNSKPIKICDNAWIGMNCIILKGVTVGEGAVVGAGSVVTKDVPAWTVVAGNPAKVVKTLSK